MLSLWLWLTSSKYIYNTCRYLFVTCHSNFCVTCTALTLLWQIAQYCIKVWCNRQHRNIMQIQICAEFTRVWPLNGCATDGQRCTCTTRNEWYGSCSMMFAQNGHHNRDGSVICLAMDGQVPVANRQWTARAWDVWNSPSCLVITFMSPNWLSTSDARRRRRIC